MKQTTLRTETITPNDNISIPIGSILAVQKYFEKLGLAAVFEKYKQRGLELPSIVQALVSYKLTENLSISRASDWINRDEVLEMFSLRAFEQRVLYRDLATVGSNHEEVIADLQDCLFRVYDFEHTNTNLDWTSLVLHGDKSPIGKYGYSRDHRPDKKQITLGLAELAHPINVPYGLTVKEGNVNDMKHFKDTYNQIRGKLREDSLVIFDKGALSKDNLGFILKDKMKYLTAKKLNKSDDKRIKAFDKSKAELVDNENGVYGIKYKKPSRYSYFFFSERLQQDQIAAKRRRALRKFLEAKQLQDCLDRNRKLPKKFRINNELVDVTYSYQTKLKELGEDEARKYIERASLNGREGFFCLLSAENLTLSEALATYRKKDSIEKIINSLKNEIEIKPLRVWTENSIKGALIIGFIAQVIISLIRYEHVELKQTSTKFIKISLMNLTVTVEQTQQRRKRRIYSNFDPINELILAQNQAVT